MRLDDVVLTPADEDRVDRLVDRADFDRNEAEAIVRFSKVDEDDRDPTLISNFVAEAGGSNVEDGFDPDECAKIRRAMDRAERPTTVIDRYPDKHPSAIFRHATGRCDHDVDVDPTTSPRILKDECREMRVDFQTGDTVEDLRHEYNRSANAVVRHVFGRCDHEFDHKRNGKELSDTLCRRMRRAYRENESTSIADIGRAFIVGASTAHRHLTGECGHGDDAEDPIGRNGSPAIDEAECDLIRTAYVGDATPSTLADAFDRDVSTVRKHLFGRCRHGGSAFEPTRDSVSARRCKAIRHEYRTRGVESVKSLIDRLNVSSRGVFYYHLYGDCSHDHDVDPVDRA